MKRKKKIKCNCEEYLNNWKRALADYENLQKNLSQQKQQMRISTIENVAQMVLPILDNFTMAFDHAPKTKTKKISQWIEGIGHIKHQYENMLDEIGLQEIDCTGIANPELHEVIDTEKSLSSEKSPNPNPNPDTQEDGKIIKIIQRGYKFGDTVIRCAKVITINN